MGLQSWPTEREKRAGRRLGSRKEEDLSPNVVADTGEPENLTRRRGSTPSE